MVADHVYGPEALAIEQEPRVSKTLSSEFVTLKDLRSTRIAAVTATTALDRIIFNCYPFYIVTRLVITF